jgi:hypothetical protein
MSVTAPQRGDEKQQGKKIFMHAAQGRDAFQRRCRKMKALYSMEIEAGIVFGDQ